MYLRRRPKLDNKKVSELFLWKIISLTRYSRQGAHRLLTNEAKCCLKMLLRYSGPFWKQFTAQYALIFATMLAKVFIAYHKSAFYGHEFKDTFNKNLLAKVIGFQFFLPQKRFLSHLGPGPILGKNFSLVKILTKKTKNRGRKTDNGR